MSGIRPAAEPAPLPTPPTITVTETCDHTEHHPSGLPATYTSGRHREAALFEPWARVHEAHGWVRR